MRAGGHDDWAANDGRVVRGFLIRVVHRDPKLIVFARKADAFAVGLRLDVVEIAKYGRWLSNLRHGPVPGSMPRIVLLLVAFNATGRTGVGVVSFARHLDRSKPAVANRPDGPLPARPA